MKIVYVAHPISWDVEWNLKKILDICYNIHKNEKDIIPFAPYIVWFHYLKDEIIEDRELWIQANLEHFKRKNFDELWVYWDIISKWVQQEIDLAIEMKIPVFYKNII